MDADAIKELMVDITAICTLVIGLFLLVCMFIYEMKCIQVQKKYLKELDDHDKAVILEYKEKGKQPLSILFKKDE